MLARLWGLTRQKLKKEENHSLQPVANGPACSEPHVVHRESLCSVLIDLKFDDADGCGRKPARHRLARPDLLFSWFKCVWLVRARRLPRVFRSYFYYAASTDDASVYRKRPPRGT